MSQWNASQFVTAIKAESPIKSWTNKNSPILADVSQWCHQFLFNDLLADLRFCQYQSPSCVAGGWYGVITFSHFKGARGKEACEIRQNLLCYREEMGNSKIGFIQSTTTCCKDATGIINDSCIFLPMVGCTLGVRHMLLSREMAAFCRPPLDDFNRGEMLGRAPNFWARILVTVMEPWKNSRTKGTKERKAHQL